MLSRKLTNRAPLLLLALPYATGVAVGWPLPIARVPLVLTCAGVLMTVSLIAAFRRAHPAWLSAAVPALVLAGAAACSLARNRLPEWESLPPREARLPVTILRVFHSKDPTHFAAIASIGRTSGPLAALDSQQVYVSGTLRPPDLPPLPSEGLVLSGLLTSVGRKPGPMTFEAYLADSGVNFKLTRARIVIVTTPPGGFSTFCDRAAHRLAALLGFGIADKQPALTGIYQAMLLGWQGELTPDQRDNFLLSGTMHLFSVSGLHILVINVTVTTILALLRLPRPLASILSLCTIALHVVITGSSPAAVRAFLLVFFHESAFVLRQPANGPAALSLASLVVLLADPLALFSASFQMSYGVVLAIVVYGSPLADVFLEHVEPFRHLPRPTWTWLHKFIHWLTGECCSAAAIGVAATLTGSVAGITYFRILAPGSLLVNLVVIPISNLAIIGGVLGVGFGLAGLPFLCSFFNHAAALDLWIVDWIVRTSVNLPGMWYAAEWRAEWIGPASLTLLCAALFAGYCTGWRKSLGGYWPPIVLTALLILVGARFGG